jgi:talin
MMSEGVVLLKPILNSQKEILAATENAVNGVKLLCTSADDQEASRKLLILIEIDQAIIESAINSLDPKENIIEKSALSDSIRAFSSLIEVIGKTVKNEPSQLGQTISATPDNFQHIVTYTIATASHLSDLSQQKTLLDDLKSSSDCLLEFLFAIKGGLAGTKNVNHPKALENGEKALRDSLGKLTGAVEGSSVIAGGGELALAIEKIESLQNIKLGKRPAERRPYPYYADKVEESGKALVELVGEILSKTKTAQQYKEKGKKLADFCQNIHGCVQLANIATDDVKIKYNLDTSFRELLVTSVRLVEAMHGASGKSNADQASRQKLTQAARQVSVNVSELISAAKEGTKGLLICQESIANVNDVISDLESCIIFAQAGQLDPVNPSENFGRNKDGMMNSAKAFVEQVKNYITIVSGSQDEFAALSMQSVNSLESLKYVYLFNISERR